MLSKHGQKLYDLIKMPYQYEIDKKMLKKNYFDMCKHEHRNCSDSNLPEKQELNKAYSVIKNDFSRAKLFTAPVNKLESVFLERCMELEERIERGEDLRKELDELIKKCKEDYKNPVSMGKWAYYERLKEKMNDITKD